MYDATEKSRDYHGRAPREEREEVFDLFSRGGQKCVTVIDSGLPERSWRRCSMVSPGVVRSV